jgi:hypothetical protein
MKLIVEPVKPTDMIHISSKGICGEDDCRSLKEMAAGQRRKRQEVFRPKSGDMDWT